MEIINFKKVGQSHSMHSWPDHLAVPDGWAIVSDELDRSVFYGHNGFVVLTTEEQVRVTGTHEEPREVKMDVVSVNEDGEEVVETVTETIYELVEDATVVNVVTAWEPDLEAWEVWQAEQPDPVEPEPSIKERLVTIEETTAQQGEILNILLSGETEASV